MNELIQQIVDGLGRGGIYALIALGIAVISVSCILLTLRMES